MTHTIRGLAKGLRQCCHFDRIAKVGARAMAFHVVHRVRGHACNGLRLRHSNGLPLHRWCEVPSLLRAIIVDRTALDHGPDMIAVRDGVRHATQHDDPGARPENRSLRTVVKGMARPVRRQDLVFFVQVATPLRQFDGRPARKCHVTLPVQQCLHGVMGGHERSRTSCLQVD